MEQVGAKLREARVARGMSLEDVSQVTKVPRSSLVALESGDRDALPALVFVKGFVRAYARAVGLEPNPLVRKLEAREHAAQLAALEADGGVAPRNAAARRHTATDPALLPLAAAASGVQRAAGVRRGYVLLVVVAAGLLLAAWLMVGGRREAPGAGGGSTASPTTPAIQDRVDGVSSMTDDDAPEERLR